MSGDKHPGAREWMTPWGSISATAAVVLATASCTTLPVPPSQSGAPAQGRFSHADLDSFLGRHVDVEGMVDYARALDDRSDLERYVGEVATASPDSTPARFTSDDDRLAYWINAYNAWVLQAVLDRYPIESVRDVRPPWPLFFVPRLAGFFYLQEMTLGGQEMSLYALENGLVRERFPDPRIHFALNCASESCPRLPRRAFRGDDLQQVLDAEARRFIGDARNVRIDARRGVVHLSSIFDWYEQDFVTWMESRHPKSPPTLLGYVSLYLGDDERARAAACGDCRVEFIPYDWTLNDQSRTSTGDR
jgi:hypothetical protein